MSWLNNSKVDDIDGESTRAAILGSMAMLSYD